MYTHYDRNRKKRALLAALSAVLLGLSACGTTDGGASSSGAVSEPSEVSEVSNVSEVSDVSEVSEVSDVPKVSELDAEVRSDVLDFSVELFKRQVEEGTNVVVSPESTYFVLGMAANGASGTTRQELLDVLCGGVDLDTFDANVSYLVGRADPDVCRVAQSVWVRDIDGLSLSETFQRRCEDYFQSETYVEDFDKRFVKTVNRWVSKNTDGMVDSILEDVPSEHTVLYLMDAISFEARWMEEYDDSQVVTDATFTDFRGEEQTATMLRSSESIYLSDGNATGFLKFYEGGQYAYVGILPNEGVSLDDYLADLTGESFDSFYSNPEPGNVVVYVSIPEYTTSSSHVLKGTLQSMGVVEAFDEDAADFSEMVDPDHSLYVSDAIQKAYVQVDREGTKAAAVDSLEMTDSDSIEDDTKYFSVYLNRPFAYAIVDVTTGVPVFMGVVNTLEE